MHLKYTASVNGGFLFEAWKPKGIVQFLGPLVFTVILVLATESLSFFIQRKLVNKEKKRSIYYNFAYFVLRFLNYTEMLVAMSFNFWLIFALVSTSALALAVFGKIDDNYFIDSLKEKEDQ